MPVVRTESAPPLTDVERRALLRLESAAVAEPFAAADLAATIAMSAPYVLCCTAAELAAEDGLLLRAMSAWFAWGLPPRQRQSMESARAYAADLLASLGAFAQWRSRDRAKARFIGREIRRFARDPYVAAGLAMVKGTGIINSAAWPAIAARALTLANEEPRPDSPSLPGQAGISSTFLNAINYAINPPSPPLPPAVATPYLEPVPPPPGFHLAPSGSPLVWSDSDYTPNGPNRKAMDASAQLWISHWVPEVPPGSSFTRVCDVTFGSPTWPNRPMIDCYPAPSNPGAGYGHWEWIKGGGGTGWEAAAFDVAKKIFSVALTAAAAYATIEIGGIGGLAAASALDIVNSLANGATLTDALVTEVSKQAKDQFAKSKFYDTYQQANALYSSAKTLSQDAINQFRADAVASSPDPVSAKQMVDAAIAVAQAKEIQARTRAAIESKLATDEERRWLDDAIKQGSDLKTWTYALYGKPGIDALNQAVSQASQEVLGKAMTMTKASVATSPRLFFSPAATPSAAPSPSSGGSGGAILAIAALGALVLAKGT